MSSGDRLEVEAKFFVADLPAFKKKLVELGAHLEKARAHEQNICYDNPWQGLQRAGKLLRLRKDGENRLTFKGSPLEDVQSEAKVREEIEVMVEDFDLVAKILSRLGFEASIQYEKYRTRYHLNGVEVALDEMPFGDFVELEGDDAGICALADLLSFDWNQRILISYLELMVLAQSHYQLPFQDLMFNNFEGVAISIPDLLETAL